MSTIKLQLPDAVLANAQRLAATDHVPLDEFVAQAVADRVAAMDGLAYLRERGRRGDRERFLAILDKAPDVEPIDPNDRVE